MIRKTKKSNNLATHINRVPIIDTDPGSNFYFRIVDFPHTFYCGKNAIRLQANNDTLAIGSTIYVDILDANGDAIYYEIVDAVGKDKTRLIIVYIYEDTPPGDITIYIGGRATVSKYTGETLTYSKSDSSNQYYNIPNMIWTRKATVAPSKQNNSEVFFVDDPIISFAEMRYPYLENSANEFRKEEKTANGGKLSIRSITAPSQFTNKDQLSRRLDYTDDSNRLTLNPTLRDKGQGTTRQQLLYSKYNELPAVYVEDFDFTASMKGGDLYIRNINLQDYAPSDAENTASFGTVSVFSASIVEVVNKNIAILSKPFIHKVDYKDVTGQNKIIGFNQLKNHTDFTASFLKASDFKTTVATESFVRMEFEKLEPIVGSVDSINIKYKPIGSTGEYTDVGQFDIYEQNLLRDDSITEISQYDGLQFKDIGLTLNQTEVNSYWDADIVKGDLSQTLPITQSNNYLDSGMELYHTGLEGENNYIKLYNTPIYNITTKKDTEYVVKFKTHVQADPTSSIKPQLDVYVSGPDVYADNRATKQNISPIKDYNLGTYIGSINSKQGILKDNSLFFKALSSDSTNLKFVVRSGIWTLSNIKLQARKSTGFTPNHVVLDIPVNSFRRDAELILNIDYYNRDGIKANTTSKILGAYFTGSNFWFKGNDNIFSGSFSGSFTGPCPPSCKSGSFTGSFTGSTDGDHTGKFTGSFTGSTDGDHTGRFTGSFTGSFDGDHSGKFYDIVGLLGTPGQIPVSDGTYFTWQDNIADAASDLIITGKNMTGATITKGTPLYFSSSNTSGNIVGVYPADAGNINRMPAGGIAAETIDPTNEGGVYIYGFINGVNTSTFESGDNVFVAVGGGYTNKRPTGSAYVQKLGNVEKSAINGSGVIQGPSWYNDLPNWADGRIKIGSDNGAPTTSTFIYVDDPNTELQVEGCVQISDCLTVTGSSKLNATGSFTGSFKGDGSQLTGITSGSSDWADITNKPTDLLSGSLGNPNEILIVGTTTNVTSSTTLNVDTANERVGIGTTNPRGTLDILGDSTNDVIMYMTQYNPDADPPNFRIEKSRGTPSSPTSVLNGDGLFSMNVFGYNAGSFNQSGQIRFDVDGSPSSGNIPTKFTIKTHDGSSYVDRLLIDGTGNIHLTGSLSVSGSSQFSDSIVADSISANTIVSTYERVISSSTQDNTWSSYDNGNLVVIDHSSENLSYILNSSPTEGDNVYILVREVLDTSFSGSISGNGNSILDSGTFYNSLELSGSNEFIHLRWIRHLTSWGIFSKNTVSI